MKQRYTELDILRFLAMLAVVGLHVNSSVWGSLRVMSFDWLIITLQRITWAVPIFVMISGRFFLDPQRPVTMEAIWKRYIPRILVAFLFWGIAYQLWYAMTNEGYTLFSQWKVILFGTITGAYHMWYLWMLIGLYAITPILRKIAEDQRLSIYFIGLYFAAQCLIYFASEFPLVGGLISQVMEKIRMNFVLGFTAYYLMGYSLCCWKPSRKQEYALYALGIIVTVAAPIGNIILAYRTGEMTEFFTKYEAPTTFIQSAALYTFFINRVSKVRWTERTRKVFALTTKYGFGAYMVHALVNEIIIIHMGFRVMLFTPILSVTVITLVVSGISLLLSAMLHKIPLIGKYIT